MKTHQMFSIHARSKESANDVFIPKTHQMFSVHTSPKKFENVTITGHSGFASQEYSEREITWVT